MMTFEEKKNYLFNKLPLEEKEKYLFEKYKNSEIGSFKSFVEMNKNIKNIDLKKIYILIDKYQIKTYGQTLVDFNIIKKKGSVNQNSMIRKRKQAVRNGTYKNKKIQRWQDD